jgi:serine/threonine-protein kinase
LAERILGGTPHRVALKVLSPHAAGASFIERFHREQHILASLDHKNITRMLDAGMSDNGQPYLVMEYVHGVHLDQYCDTQKLGIRERIELFLQVCDAVAYAHRNLIVHLDLKPSNVLVNEEGTVKLLDFGTSKLIQPESMLTTTVLATPAYVSPEQLRNEPGSNAIRRLCRMPRLPIGCWRRMPSRQARSKWVLRHQVLVDVQSKLADK